VLGLEVEAVKKTSIDVRLLKRTIDELKKAGHDGFERLVLWLGRIGGDECHVIEVFSPPQEATGDSFWIDESAMQSVLQHLRLNRLAIVAQVHSHPYEAFHSPADDTWAIVRHLGALSVVVPNFALKTTIESFSSDAAVYELTSQNMWRRISRRQFSMMFTVGHGKS
jgi:hypothetical protein